MKHASKLAIANLVVLAMAAPASQVAGLPDQLVERFGDSARRQAVDDPWVTLTLVGFTAEEPVEIVAVRYETVAPKLMAGRAVLWPARQNGNVRGTGVCGHAARAGWYAQPAVGTTLIPGETYSLAVPLRPRSGGAAVTELSVEGVTVVFRLGRRVGDQTFQRSAVLKPSLGNGSGPRCTGKARAHWIYETLRPPLTQPRVHNLWGFVASYAAGCPQILTTGRADPTGKNLFSRISSRIC